MDDREIISEFVVESREHLADIENQLLSIEAAGADVDAELVNTVFRAVHSIKGAAGFLGFSTVAQLAHDLENVLNHIRNGQLVPSAEVTNVLLRSADRLRALIDDINHSNGFDVTEYLDALQKVVADLVAEEARALGDSQLQERFPSVERTLAEPAEPATTPPRRAAQDRGPGALPTAAGPAVEPAPTASTPAESNIRVAVTVLDRLMNLAGELVLARNQLLQTAANSDHAALGSVASRMNQVTSELQETIMQTRLQPIATVFGRFPRVVRDLSNGLGKQCQLTIEGQEVELDKSIIEAVNDPLTHLVRNAVDHGIESPEARIQAGKPPVGTLALRAFHQAGKVNIQISDDGRGIDVARLKEKAIARGLLSAEQGRIMSDREAIQLIFRPGFSMAEQVTEVSGRGVGMDVVKTNIERLGGTVAVDTQLGKGTTVHVKLPLTLAIIPSLVVRSAGRRYAIPQTSIRELVRVKAAEAAQRIERVKRAEVFRLRGDLLPLIRLNNALNQEAPSGTTGPARAVSIIVVEAGHLRYGLIVDGLCDSEEIVVKPLGRHMKGCNCLAGATILGDGRVALILDIAGIATHSQLAVVEEEPTRETSAVDASQETQAILMFSNHPSEYFGIPMELVARLERVPTDQIDSVGGQQVLQYRGGTLPLLSLEGYVACKPREEAAHIHVAVFAAAQREIGLLVPELFDIRSVPTQVDTFTFREPGILGSLVYEHKTVRLVDLHELTRKAHPEWYDAQPVPQTSEGAAPRILLVEDSDFFRKQLAGFLETAGYEVQGCEDGHIAWNTLQAPDSHFDLVVTDIEMPNMNGIELAECIRSNPRWAQLPVIAVSSLAGEDDILRGRRVGIDEYHVKLDREQLMASVARLLRRSQAQTLARSSS
jgi:two-component system chemotaxis sensor kinase CheA